VSRLTWRSTGFVCLLLTVLAGMSWCEAAPVKTEAYAEAIRVACVGDSITYGAGAKDREKNCYPEQLGRMLGEKWVVRNFGVSGATLLNKGDKPYTKEKAFKEAMEFKPDVVVTKLGTNDSKPQNWRHKAEFAADYRDLIAQFRKINPSVRVYACLPVPAYPGQWGIRDSIIKGEVIGLVKQVAQDSQADVIDLYTALRDKTQLFPDTVHPNTEGAGLIAGAVCRELTGKGPPTTQEAKAKAGGGYPDGARRDVYVFGGEGGFLQ